MHIHIYLFIRTHARQVVALSEYRIQLYDYLKNRMIAIAPNLTIMVGELVGARLIAHAGSLLNLAKQPVSFSVLLVYTCVQIHVRAYEISWVPGSLHTLAVCSTWRNNR
jgi:hypothetical protein